MLFFSYFKELVGKEVMMELKNDLAIRGTLHSVDQYLNIKLENIKVVDEDKYPHMTKTNTLTWYSSLLQPYFSWSSSAMDYNVVASATHTPLLHSVPFWLLGQSLLIYGDPLHFRLRKSKTSSDPVIFHSCFISYSRSLRCLCSADPKGTGSRQDKIVSGMVEKLLQREENKALMDWLEKASTRVDRAREALADVER
ncbi:hypothetical protein ZIOFF_028268 [Zingiber officinale]|uniref:Sm domain-containing protein n=1 Tax=Zingiber officinale TaxID=94328 RepID=A0A8J5GZH6_ZINOF|nr:hypothetical protein ZIOFF_028268 [Zingiber officinale]